MASQARNTISSQDAENELHLKRSKTREEVTAHGRPVRGFRWVLVCLAIYSTALLYGLDTTIAADIQAAVVETFDSVQEIAWLGVGFPLGSVATILPIGLAYGLFDAKWLFIGSLILFEAGSALCGGAPNMDALIIGRVIAGIGGAGIYLGGLNYFSIFTTLRERPLYIAAIGLVWGVGTVLGPVVGGLFSDNSPTWRWSFYINLVIAGIFAPVYLFLLPSFKPDPNRGILSKLADFDWVGIVLVAAVYGLFVTSLTFAGATWAWSDGRIIAMLVVLGVLTVVAIVQQRFSIFTTPSGRVFPVQFLRSRTILLLFFGTACASTAIFVPVYFIPVYFQFVHGDSALKAAVRLLPYMTIAITFIMLNGIFMPKIGYYMPFYVFTGVLLLISGPLMFTVDQHTAAGNIYGYAILMAAGAGATAQAGYSVAQAKVSEKDMAAVIGLINTAQLGSIVIALTISGAIFQNLALSNLRHNLAQFNFSDADIRAAVAGAQSSIFQGSDPQVRNLAIDAIVTAISRVYTLVIAAGALCLISAFFMKREKLFMVEGAPKDVEAKSADASEEKL